MSLEIHLENWNCRRRIRSGFECWFGEVGAWIAAIERWWSWTQLHKSASVVLHASSWRGSRRAAGAVARSWPHRSSGMQSLSYTPTCLQHKFLSSKSIPAAQMTNTVVQPAVRRQRIVPCFLPYIFNKKWVGGGKGKRRKRKKMLRIPIIALATTLQIRTQF